MRHMDGWVTKKCAQFWFGIRVAGVRGGGAEIANRVGRIPRPVASRPHTEALYFLLFNHKANRAADTHAQLHCRYGTGTMTHRQHYGQLSIVKSGIKLKRQTDYVRQVQKLVLSDSGELASMLTSLVLMA